MRRSPLLPLFAGLIGLNPGSGCVDIPAFPEGAPDADVAPGDAADARADGAADAANDAPNDALNDVPEVRTDAADAAPEPDVPFSVYPAAGACQWPPDEARPGSLVWSESEQSIGWTVQDVTYAPGPDRVYLMESSSSGDPPSWTESQISSYAPTAALDDKKTFMVLPGVWGSGYPLMRGIAFHPGWPAPTEAFVSYLTGGPDAPDSPEPLRVVVSRVSTDAAGTAGFGEEVLLEVPLPHANVYRAGGTLAFGPDGHLYVALGDGSDNADAAGAQDDSSLPGSILRIDVDTSAPDGGPAAPPDNPFADREDLGRLIWAWGLRQPVEIGFDAVTGHPWVADGGTFHQQTVVSELNLPFGGANLGWPEATGATCGDLASVGCDPRDFVPPVAELAPVGQDPQDDVVPLGVYRSDALPGLWGAFLWYHTNQHQLYAWWPQAEAPPGDPLGPVDPSTPLWGGAILPDGTPLLTGRFLTSAWTATAEGAVDLPDAFHRTLSEAGCFGPSPGAPVSGVHPYELHSPQRIGFAESARHLALPPGSTVGYQEGPPAGLDLPEGTALLQTWYLDVVIGESATRRPIETRVLIRAGADNAVPGWHAFSYRWREDGSDADLLPAGATRVVLARDPDTGEDREVRWDFPSRRQCASCHALAPPAPVGPLGLTLDQVKLDEPALVALDQAGALTLDGAPVVDPLPGLDSGDTPERLARSYLHANCASCHQPGGRTGLALDLRFTSALADTGLCGPPARWRMGHPENQLIAPGNPLASLLWLRVAAPEAHHAPYRMPPLSGDGPSSLGADLLAAWIETLESCP